VTAEDVAWARGHKRQQVELDWRKPHLPLTHLHPPLSQVNPEILDQDLAAPRLGVAASQQGVDASDQLTRIDRLDHVIIRPHLEAIDEQIYVAAGIDQQDGQVTEQPQLGAGSKTVRLGVAYIEDDHIVLAVFDADDRIEDIVNRGDDVVRLFKDDMEECGGSPITGRHQDTLAGS